MAFATSLALTPPDQDVERRRPVWEALSDLFLDTELDDEQHRQIAQAIVASGYSPSEIQAILWDEVFPVVYSNVLDAAGVWTGFDLDWLQQEILSGRHRRSLFVHIVGALPYTPPHIIRQEWQALLPFLPKDFRHDRNAD